jgi:hypothetical protein
LEATIMKKWLYAVTALAAMCAPASAQVVNTKTGQTYTFTNADCDPNGRRLILFDNASGVAASLPQAGANGQFISGCIIKVQNIGEGNVVITPTTSAINEATSFTLTPGASSSIVADAGPTVTGNYWAATGGVPPGGNGRLALQSMPAYYTMSDFGAASAPAKRRSAQISSTNSTTAVQIETTYSITASRLVCTNGSTTVTMTPGVFPNSANQAGTKRISLPGCGAAAATLQANVTSITSEGTTQTIVIGTVASTDVDGGAEVVIGPQGLTPASAASSIKRLTYNVAKYSPITFAAGTTTLTAPAGTFATYDYTQPPYVGGYLAEVAIPNATGTNCADTLVTKILAIDGTRGIATLADAPRCALTNVSRWFYWGQAIFGPDDVGSAIELLDSASSGTTPLVTTIASVTDPSHIVLGNNNQGTKTNYFTRLTWGRDVTSSWVAMTAAARAAGFQYLYIPINKAYFLATGTLVSLTQNGASLIWCGEGNVYLPTSLNLARPVSRACNAGTAPPLADSTIVPSVHLRTASNSGSTLKLAFIGDSQLTYNYNSMGRMTMPQYICDAFKRQNPAKSVTCDNFAIGGQVFGTFDPTGPDFGNGAGIPSGATLPTWYTPTSNQWYTFVQAACPDVVILKLGYNDGVTLLWSAVQSTMNTLQGSTWRTACGNNPDVLIATEGPPGMATASGSQNTQNKDYSMAYLRGWALSCEYRLTNGGCPGLIDIGRARALTNLGWSQDQLAPSRADYLVPPSTANDGFDVSAAVYTWPVPIYDYQVFLNGFRAIATTPTEWWASVGTVDFSLGNGASGTPESAGTQTGLTTPYSGGHVRLGFDTGTANYTVRVRTFDVDTAATVSVATTTVTCAAACTNMGFTGAKIEIPGAGIAAGIYTGTITAINSAGTSITITPAVNTALVSAAVTLKFYHEPVPTTDTGVLATCVNFLTVCDSALIFALKGNTAQIFDGSCFNCQPVWTARVAKFGGYHRPTITVSGTFSRYRLSTNVNGLSRGTASDPADGTFYQVNLSDTNAWGLAGEEGQWGGGGFNHPSTLGDQTIMPVVMGALNLTATPAPVSSAVNTPVNGFSYSVPDQQVFTAFTPAGTLATGTVELPRNVPQGSLIQVMSTEEITSLTVHAPSGYTLQGAVASTLAADATVAWRLNGTAFYRVQ